MPGGFFVRRIIWTWCYLARLMLNGRVCYPHHQSWTDCRRHTHCRIFESSRTLRINEGTLHNYYVDQYRNSNTVDASTVVISNYWHQNRDVARDCGTNPLLFLAQRPSSSMGYWPGWPGQHGWFKQSSLICQELVKTYMESNHGSPCTLPWITSKHCGVCRIYKEIQRDLTWTNPRDTWQGREWKSTITCFCRNAFVYHTDTFDLGQILRKPWQKNTDTFGDFWNKYIADIAAYLVTVFNLFHLMMTYHYQVCRHSSVATPFCILRWFEKRPILMLQGQALARILGIAANIEEERLGLRDGGWTWCAEAFRQTDVVTI